MYSKRTIFNIFLFTLTIILLCSATVQARDYSIENVNVRVNVSDNGIVHVKEAITYNFDGTYSEVFRQVYPPSGGSVQNITGYCSDESCKFEVRTISDGYELVGMLAHPTPSKVTFYTSYDYYGGLKVYNDLSELHYKMWGEEWDKSVNNFVATITLPAQQSSITYWTHPQGYTSSSNIKGNTINIYSYNVPSNSWYEIRAVFPRLQSPNPQNVQIYNYDARSQIEKIERDIVNKQKIVNIIFYIYILLFLSLLFVPIYLYYRYGREPNIAYDQIYERELPDDSRPAIVNAMMQSQIGVPNMNGFAATVMDLIDRGYFTINDSNPDDVVLQIVDNVNTSELLDYEDDVYNLIMSYSNNGQLNWKNFKSELKKGTSFYEFIQDWNSKVSINIDTKRIFIDEGVTKMTIWGIILFILSFGGIFIVPLFFSSLEVADSGKLFFVQFAIAFLSIFIIVFNNLFKKVLGRWTSDGKLYEAKWNNFKKYISDFSALKDHPPGSVKIWDHYMVYAMALGVAEQALKNMSLIVPEEIRTNSHFYNAPYFAAYGSDFGHAYNSSAPSSHGGSSGVGGGGGGFGGGGGGAR